MTDFEKILSDTIVNLRVRQLYEPRLSTIVMRLEQLKASISHNNIRRNPIKGIVRAYLDVFSDFDDPIIEKLGYLEREVERITESS